MTQEQKTVELMESEKALQIIRKEVGKFKNLNLVEVGAATGFSYFAGKKRLCKILKTKRGVTLEINVKLSGEVKDLPGMETISVQQAHKKHLGTMKHYYRSTDAKQIQKIIAEALKQFKAEMEAGKKEEEKAQVAEA
jgi:hypothetical protein